MRAGRIAIAIGVIVLGFVVAILVGQVRENSKAEEMLARLRVSVVPAADLVVDFASFSELPPPVARYFKHVLTDGQQFINLVKIRQSGMLRTGTTSETWLPFTASQVVAPPARSFLWNARVEMPLATHLRVLDSYINGSGAGRVSLLSAFAVAAEAGLPELNSGALHRYLAEAVWFPTALLPESGVRWTPIDDHSALATLTDQGVTVALEFRFNRIGEVTGIYSSGRFGKFDGGYRQVPWQGRFRDYQTQAGMRVPQYAEVGWYDDKELQLVWTGNLIEAQYQFEP